MTHLVVRPELDVHVRGAAAGLDAERAVLDRLGALWHERLLPVLDEAFTAAAGPDVTLRIDRLELDLGRLDPDRLEDAFPEALRAALARELPQLPPPSPDATRAADRLEASRPTPDPSAPDALALLTRFLATGTLPWWTRADRVDLDAIVRDVLADPGTLAALVAGAGHVGLRRLAWQVRPETVTALLRAWTPDADAIESAAAVWQTVAEAIGLDAARSRSALRDAMLTAARPDLGPSGPVLPSALPQSAATPSVGRAHAHAVARLAALAGQAPTAWIGAIRDTVETAALPPLVRDWVTALAPSPTPSAPSEAGRDRTHTETPPPVEDAPPPPPEAPRDASAEPASPAEPAPPTRPGGALAETPPPPPDALPVDGRAEPDPLPPQAPSGEPRLSALPGAPQTDGEQAPSPRPDRPTPRAVPDTSTPAHTAFHAAEDKAPLPPVSPPLPGPAPPSSALRETALEATSSPAAPRTDAATPAATRPAEPLYVYDAGLVLLAPFLPRFLGTLGLLADDGTAFASASDQRRAVALVAGLASGEAAHPEPALTLAKVLGGMALAAPAEREIAPTDAEREETEALLQAVIGHWSVLGATSVDGLREAFLRRDGRLDRTDDTWALTVERRGMDVLVDAIPWPIRAVRLPWMETPLTVTW